MDFYKSTALKVSDLRRWRSRRDGDIIIFFRDGTIFDTFLKKANIKTHLNGRPSYWRGSYQLINNPGLAEETLFAFYKKQFELWLRVINKQEPKTHLSKTDKRYKNGINSI